MSVVVLLNWFNEPFSVVYHPLFTEERMKAREVIPRIGPIPIIPLKLFLEGIVLLADNREFKKLLRRRQRQRDKTIIGFNEKNKGPARAL